MLKNGVSPLEVSKSINKSINVVSPLKVSYCMPPKNILFREREESQGPEKARRPVTWRRPVTGRRPVTWRRPVKRRTSDQRGAGLQESVCGTGLQIYCSSREQGSWRSD